MINLLLIPPLIYGAIVDYRKREIPNIVPLIICGVGIAAVASNVSVLIGRFFVAALILGSYLLMTSNGTVPKIGGGDLKLMASLTIAIGSMATAIVIFVVVVMALIIRVIKAKSIKHADLDNIPMCTYTLPAFCFVYISSYILCAQGWII